MDLLKKVVFAIPYLKQKKCFGGVCLLKSSLAAVKLKEWGDEEEETLRGDGVKTKRAGGSKST